LEQCDGADGEQRAPNHYLLQKQPHRGGIQNYFIKKAEDPGQRFSLSTSEQGAAYSAPAAKHTDLVSLCQGDTPLVKLKVHKDFFLSLPHDYLCKLLSVYYLTSDLVCINFCLRKFMAAYQFSPI